MSSLAGRTVVVTGAASGIGAAVVAAASVAAMRDAHDVNVLGPLLGIQALAPLMPAGGSIVTIGSLAALQGHYPVAYTTSKWAVRGLTRTAALELGERGIPVDGGAASHAGAKAVSDALR